MQVAVVVAVASSAGQLFSVSFFVFFLDRCFMSGSQLGLLAKLRCGCFAVVAVVAGCCCWQLVNNWHRFISARFGQFSQMRAHNFSAVFSVVVCQRGAADLLST